MAIVDWRFVAELFGGILATALVGLAVYSATLWLAQRFFPKKVVDRDTSPDTSVPFLDEDPTLKSSPGFVDAIETPVPEVATCTECGRRIDDRHQMNWDASGGPMHLECMLVKHGSKGAA